MHSSEYCTSPVLLYLMKYLPTPHFSLLRLLQCKRLYFLYRMDAFSYDKKKEIILGLHNNN